MAQRTIFEPFFATMLLTAAVWLYMYLRRIALIVRVKPTDLDQPRRLAEISPPAVSNPSDNLKNLFELPVLFYVLALYLFATREVDRLYVEAAWVFVEFRILHSAVRCTINFVMLQFYFSSI